MKFSLLLALGLFSTVAMAIPNAPEINPLTRRLTQSVQRKNTALFEGIVKLSNCSGSLVAFKGMPKKKKALVMTNGHCVSPMARFGAVTVNHPATRSLSVFDSNMKLHPLMTSKIVYSTMTFTDVTFYETTMTYQQIEDQYKVEALVIDDVITGPGQQLDIPSGYWEISTSCAVEAIVPLLKEGEWYWKESIRYSEECKTKGGYSGSPVIARHTKTVIGIHNTGNNGLLDCSDNNPCEIGANGQVTYRELNRRYGQQVHQVYTCLTPDFEIDIKIPGCELAQPK
jgi:hypothetical protein